MSCEKSGDCVRCSRLFADARPLHQLAERHRRDHHPMVIKVAGQEAVDDEPPVEGEGPAGRAHDLEDDGRAVRGDRIIEFGLFGHRGRLRSIFEQQRASLFGRSFEPIEAHVLAAHVRAQPHRIAFGGGEIDQGVGFERVGDRRELAGSLPSNLDRPGDELAALESETHDDMGHLRARPIGKKEIERLELRKVVGALAPLFGEVAVCPPVEIPNVGQRQNVAYDCSGGLPRDVRRPVAVERRLDRAPPDEQAAEGGCEDNERGQASAKKSAAIVARPRMANKSAAAALKDSGAGSRNHNASALHALMGAMTSAETKTRSRRPARASPSRCRLAHAASFPMSRGALAALNDGPPEAGSPACVQSTAGVIAEASMVPPNPE